MIPEEIAKKALDKLKVYGVKLNEAEHEEALNWLKTQILEYGEQQCEPLLKEIERLEGVISEARYNLPTECPVCEEFGYDDIKFCHYRNGEGNKCLKCIG